MDYDLSEGRKRRGEGGEEWENGRQIVQRCPLTREPFVQFSARPFHRPHSFQAPGRHINFRGGEKQPRLTSKDKNRRVSCFEFVYFDSVRMRPLFLPFLTIFDSSQGCSNGWLALRDAIGRGMKTVVRIMNETKNEWRSLK